MTYLRQVWIIADELAAAGTMLDWGTINAATFTNIGLEFSEVITALAARETSLSFRDSGIRHHRSCPHTLKQSGTSAVSLRRVWHSYLTHKYLFISGICVLLMWFTISIESHHKHLEFHPIENCSILSPIMHFYGFLGTALFTFSCLQFQWILLLFYPFYFSRV